MVTTAPEIEYRGSFDTVVINVVGGQGSIGRATSTAFDPPSARGLFLLHHPSRVLEFLKLPLKLPAPVEGMY